jgi:hypothetical protein
LLPRAGDAWPQPIGIHCRCIDDMYN